jgi:hypothetical protein
VADPLQFVLIHYTVSDPCSALSAVHQSGAFTVSLLT